MISTQTHAEILNMVASATEEQGTPILAGYIRQASSHMLSANLSAKQEIESLKKSLNQERQRLEWLARQIPGNVTRKIVGVMSCTGDPSEWRQKIDSAAGLSLQK